MSKRIVMVVGVGMVIGGVGVAMAMQGPPDANALIAAQKDAMQKLQRLDGQWRGDAWTMLPTGKHEITQTERIGPFLDGAVKVIEGRGFDKDGSVSFNALGIISFDPATKTYSMRSYAMGRAGDFELKLTDDGYSWDIPAGPMTIHYSATIKDGTWHEVGDRIIPGRDPVRFFEMTLKRIGDSDWPGGNAMKPE